MFRYFLAYAKGGAGVRVRDRAVLVSADADLDNPLAGRAGRDVFGVARVESAGTDCRSATVFFSMKLMKGNTLSALFRSS